ncbi:MAG: quinoprotein dehydrogenase-associated putative ABC transporter substrate-binding protein [Phycisphaerae bacterium]|nr:quinoprotein dehydrogenase-associated putative ABC transporter substrate-binding protein [Gemmatimonadaceae bacterium]
MRRLALGSSAVFVLMLAGGAKRPIPATTLRVCADPNNLPFSDRAGQGFENKMAERLATSMQLKLEYTWWAQRRGFIRNTLNAGECDVVMGVPSSMDLLSATRPYYRSTYVFVTRADRRLDIRSFNDSALRKLRIGVQLIGDDFANTPPAHALAARGMVRNIVGFTVYGDYRERMPAARIVDAVIRGDVDVAVVWGPLGAYAARAQGVPLAITMVSPRIDLPYLPFVYDIGIGVRRSDSTFRSRLDEWLVRDRVFIDSVLHVYHVPRLEIVSRTRSR